MGSLSVLDVGDGACSVLRGQGTLYRTAVVDCGGIGARRAARLLHHELGPRGHVHLDGLVVTHFDADHWRGLAGLPGLLTSARDVPSALPLFYPAVPFGVSSRLPAGVPAFVSHRGAARPGLSRWTS